MLVSALRRPRVRSCRLPARVEQQYRFFSYGDCMFLA